MPLYRATTTVQGEAAAIALRDALDELPAPPLAGDVHDHDDGTGAWDAEGLFDGVPDAVGLALLAEMHAAPDFRVAVVEERDWVAQVRAELTPVAAGRFVVHGSHDRARVPVNRIGLLIEAAQAFGTGHHATTQGCLTALDRLARRGFRPRTVADIGGGTGVLAMGAVALWPKAQVLAGDIDPMATRTARENAAANGRRVGCVTAAGFRQARLQRAARFELILANILAAPLKRLAPDAARRQAPGGIVVLSGLLNRQAPGVSAVYRAWGYRPLGAVRIDGWSTLVLRKAV